MPGVDVEALEDCVVGTTNSQIPGTRSPAARIRACCWTTASSPCSSISAWRACSLKGSVADAMAAVREISSSPGLAIVTNRMSTPDRRVPTSDDDDEPAGAVALSFGVGSTTGVTTSASTLERVMVAS